MKTKISLVILVFLLHITSLHLESYHVVKPSHVNHSICCQMLLLRISLTWKDII